MFISKDEKKYLFTQVKSLKIDLGHILSDIIFLKGKIKTAEGNIFVLKQEAQFKKDAPKPKKPKTEAQKAKQREYMRTYKAKKLAEKKALEQK
jgi:regulator of replication initiation timing